MALVPVIPVIRGTEATQTCMEERPSSPSQGEESSEETRPAEPGWDLGLPACNGLEEMSFGGFHLPVCNTGYGSLY